MEHDTEIFNAIKQVLFQQIKNLQNMQVLLDEELKAVKDRNGEALLAVSAKKEQLLKSIKQVDAQCSGEAQIQFISQHSDLTEIKEDISSLLVECQTKNEVVYLSATQNQVAIDEVKRLLIGGSKNTTYDAYGKKQSGGSLGKGIKA